MKLSKRIVRNAALSVLAAGTVVGTQLPTTSIVSSLVKAPPENPVMKEVREQAKGNKVNVMQELRMYTQFRKKCRDLVGANPNYTCPDYNDRKAVEAFVSGKEAPAPSAAVHPAATASATGATVLRNITDLSEEDQVLMRRFLNARSCPDSLKNHTPGFYGLCKKLILKNLSRSERRGVTEKVDERFKDIRDAKEAHKAARLERRKKAQ